MVKSHNLEVGMILVRIDGPPSVSPRTVTAIGEKKYLFTDSMGERVEHLRHLDSCMWKLKPEEITITEEQFDIALKTVSNFASLKKALGF